MTVSDGVSPPPKGGGSRADSLPPPKFATATDARRERLHQLQNDSALLETNSRPNWPRKLGHVENI